MVQGRHLSAGFSTCYYSTNFKYINFMGLCHMLLSVQHMAVFFLCRHSPSDMTFLLVYVQNLSGLPCQHGVYLHETLRHVLVDCGLRNSERLCRLSHRRIVFNNIVGNIDCAFLDIIFQRKSPQNTFLHCMRGWEGLWLLYLYSFTINCRTILKL